MKTLLLFLFIIPLTLLSQQRTDAEAELLALYNKAITNWKNSNEVQDLVSQNPELLDVINGIEAKTSNGNINNVKMHYLSLFDGKLTDIQLATIKEFFNPENLTLIEGAYWGIVESSESKEIANAALSYLERVKSDLTNRINNLPKKH
ncbi:MAG: hypothetical protein AAGA43_15800 [Bacteroidota bacterium]